MAVYDITMVGRFRSISEPEDVYVVLVAELLGGWISAAVIGPMYMGFGLFIALSLTSSLAMTAELKSGPR